MAEFNRDLGYEVVSPSDPAVLGATVLTRIELREGLYSRVHGALDLSVLSDELTREATGASLLDYQIWVEHNWKTSQGSYNSVQRFSDKLDEEYAETLEQLSQADPDRAELVSEFGDLTWCILALAANGGANIDAGLKNRLFRYLAGTQWIVGGQPTEPNWHAKAASLATKFKPVTIGEIDELIEHGFEPSPSPIMNIYDPDGPEYDEFGHMTNLQASILALKVLANRQYGRLQGEEAKEVVLSDKFKELANELGEIAANAFLELVFTARYSRGMKLEDIVSSNVQKLNKRVRDNQVDKTDSPRR